MVFEEREKLTNGEKNLSEQRKEVTTNFYLPRSSPGHILGDLGTFLRFCKRASSHDTVFWRIVQVSHQVFFVRLSCKHITNLLKKT